MVCLPPSSHWRVPREVIAWLKDAAHLVHSGPRVSVRRWEGPEWSVVYVDTDNTSSELELRHLLFAESPVTASTERVFLCRLPGVVRTHVGLGRLVVCDLNRLFTWRFAGASCVRMFPWMRAVLDVSAPIGTIIDRFTNSRRRELARVEKLDFAYGESRDPAEFDRFYREMHLPFIAERFGERARLRPMADQRRFFLERGELLWVKHQDSPVAAVLGTRRRYSKTFCALRLGLDTDREHLVRRDAITAMYWHIINWSRARHLHFVDFGRAPARLSDGLFLYKHRWGIRFERDRTFHTMWTFAWKELPEGLVRRLNDLAFVAEAGRERRCAVFSAGPTAGLSPEEIALRRKIIAQAGLDGFLQLGGPASGLDGSAPGSSSADTYAE